MISSSVLKTASCILAIAFCNNGQPMISSSVLKTASCILASISSKVTNKSIAKSVPLARVIVLAGTVLVAWLILRGGGGDFGGGSVFIDLSLVKTRGLGGGLGFLFTSRISSGVITCMKSVFEALSFVSFLLA